MTNVIVFPRVHARASPSLRAAKAAKSAAVTPDDDARGVARIEDHHSAGMLFRWRHFVTVGKRQSISEAKSSREGQRSIKARKDVICEAIKPSIGQSVLKCKANLSLDRRLSLGHTAQMVDAETEAQYKQSFIDRVKAARIATGMKQWQVAEALGMPQDKYKQYESRSLIPHHLIGRFCIVTRVDSDWLVTGRGQKPIKPLQLAEQEPAPTRKPKRTRSTKAA